MASIPEPLAKRYDLLKELDTAYDLLESLQANSNGAEKEIAFVSERISTLEESLNSSLPLAEKLIDLLHFDVAAWTAASLHFLQGFEWASAAERVGMSEDAVKSRVYRIFKSHTRSCEKRIKAVERASS